MTADNPRRLGLLQAIAKQLANNYEAVTDCYDALELLTGEDLSGNSVSDLLGLAVQHLGHGALADIWRAAFDVGLINEAALQQWIIYEGVTDATTGSGPGTEH